MGPCSWHWALKINRVHDVPWPRLRILHTTQHTTHYRRATLHHHQPLPAYPKHTRPRVPQGQTNCTSFHQHIIPSPWQSHISHCCVTYDVFRRYHIRIPEDTNSTESRIMLVSPRNPSLSILRCSVLLYDAVQWVSTDVSVEYNAATFRDMCWTMNISGGRSLQVRWDPKLFRPT